MIDEMGLATELTKIATQLEAMADGASFVADGHVRVRDPAYLIDKLKASAAAIERLVAERDEARAELKKTDGSFHIATRFNERHIATVEGQRDKLKEALTGLMQVAVWDDDSDRTAFDAALDRARQALGDT